MHYVSMWHQFWSITLHIAYSFKHLNLIQYVNGLSKSLLTFQVNDSKVTINLDEFSFLLELMVQQPSIQSSQLTTHIYENENFDSALMFHCSIVFII
jgi:hypothetical protein